MRSNENKAKTNRLKKAIFAVSFTVFLPLGVVLIILGAGKSGLVLASGITLAVLGFYGAPILWLKFGEAVRYERLALAIYHDKLRKLSDIAAQIHANEGEAENLIKTAIEKRIIEGFIFDAEKKEIKPLAAFAKEKEIVAKCSSCGATVKIKESDPRCPYCGSAIKIKE